MQAERGRFITFEGIDGAGKSTHIHWLKDWLEKRQISYYITREPGGTPLGEKLRALLLNEAMDIETETLLMFAARRAHLEEVIMPKLKAGVWVISDRFTDATYAYQGGGRGVSWEKIALLESWVQGDLQPDLTLLFDISSDISAERLKNARVPDRFEQEQTLFFDNVRKGYAKRLEEWPLRIKRIDATRTVEEIQQVLKAILAAHFDNMGG